MGDWTDELTEEERGRLEEILRLDELSGHAGWKALKQILFERMGDALWSIVSADESELVRIKYRAEGIYNILRLVDGTAGEKARFQHLAQTRFEAAQEAERARERVAMERTRRAVGANQAWLG